MGSTCTCTGPILTKIPRVSNSERTTGCARRRDIVVSSRGRERAAGPRANGKLFDGPTMYCWATSQGDCCDVQSREHYFSEALFPGPSIRVRGFPWCKDADVEIPLSKARSKLLCKHHNERL